MDCREFRDRHLAYVDGSLSELELVQMQQHLSECVHCSRRDTAVRRGLMVLRNLPSIEPSVDFTARLNAKLRMAKLADERALLYRGPGLGAFVASAAGVVAVGFLAAGLFNAPVEPDMQLPPVIAMRPALPQPALASHAFVLSAASGIPMLPAAVFAEQAPMRFMNVDYQLASWNP
ncbi:MAG: zf-HC2 domain-containing protein [Gemmatimonadaceae bacterium]